jgi:hypothetical protein
MAAAGTANPNTAIGNPGIIEFESRSAFFTLNNHVFYPHKDYCLMLSQKVEMYDLPSFP